MLVSLGRMLVDSDNAIIQAIQSTLSPISAIQEIVQNSIDWDSKNIIIRLFGKNTIIDNDNMIDLTGLRIEDDGIGMDHARVIEGFSAVYGNSTSHNTTSQAGRNGVGVKTTLQYFKKIEVHTTTNQLIPKIWNCSTENLNKIKTSYNQVSTLKPGDKDTELRKYVITLRDVAIDTPWDVIDYDVHKTIVSLSDPRNGCIRISLNQLVRKLSHNISFLKSKSKNSDVVDDQRIVIEYNHPVTGTQTSKNVYPFYDTSKSHHCHLVGDSSHDSFLHFPELRLDPSKIEANTNKDLGNVSFDIKLLEEGPGDFVISVCGASIYDNERFPTNAINNLISLSKYKFKNIAGFTSKIFGYVKIDDIQLKRELRHNKSALDESGRYSAVFIDYITSILKKMDDLYDKLLESSNTTKEDSLLKDVMEELNLVLLKQVTTTKGEELKTVSYHHYHCNSCGIDWQVPKDKIPTFCAQYNIEKSIEGCESTDILRNKGKVRPDGDGGNGLIEPEFKNTLGNFVAARFDQPNNKVYLSKFHPAFVALKTDDPIKKVIIIEKALSAIALTRMVDNLPDKLNYLDKFEIAQGQFLKEHFSNRKPSFKAQCKRIWKENNIDFDQI